MIRKYKQIKNSTKEELIEMYDNKANAIDIDAKYILRLIEYKENEEFKEHQKKHNWVITICTILIFILTIINTIFIIIK